MDHLGLVLILRHSQQNLAAQNAGKALKVTSEQSGAGNWLEE